MLVDRGLVELNNFCFNAHTLIEWEGESLFNTRTHAQKWAGHWQRGKKLGREVSGRTKWTLCLYLFTAVFCPFYYFIPYRRLGAMAGIGGRGPWTDPVRRQGIFGSRRSNQFERQRLAVDHHAERICIGFIQLNYIETIYKGQLSGRPRARRPAIIILILVL